MKIIFAPKTHLGKWSVELIIIFFLFLISFYFLVYSGQRGGDTFFSNPLLAIPMILAGISGIIAFFTGLINILRNRERSIFVFLATIIGFFVLFWVLGEILFPH